MHFSLQKVLSLLLCASPGLSSPLQQSPLGLPCHSEVDTISGIDQITDVQYGYQGPGVYNIIAGADGYNLALGSQGTGDGDVLVVWTANVTQSQRWFISDVGGGYVTIASNRSGVLVTAIDRFQFTPTKFISPEELGTHWRLSIYSTDDPENRVKLYNAKYDDNLLEVYAGRTNVNGALVCNWVGGEDFYPREVWLLKYLGPS